MGPESIWNRHALGKAAARHTWPFTECLLCAGLARCSGKVDETRSCPREPRRPLRDTPPPSPPHALEEPRAPSPRLLPACLSHAPMAVPRPLRACFPRCSSRGPVHRETAPPSFPGLRPHSFSSSHPRPSFHSVSKSCRLCLQPDLESSPLFPVLPHDPVRARYLPPGPVQWPPHWSLLCP